MMAPTVYLHMAKREIISHALLYNARTHIMDTAMLCNEGTLLIHWFRRYPSLWPRRARVVCGSLVRSTASCYQINIHNVFLLKITCNHMVGQENRVFLSHPVLRRRISSVSVWCVYWTTGTKISKMKSHNMIWNNNRIRTSDQIVAFIGAQHGHSFRPFNTAVGRRWMAANHIKLIVVAVWHHRFYDVDLVVVQRTNILNVHIGDRHWMLSVVIALVMVTHKHAHWQ